MRASTASASGPDDIPTVGERDGVDDVWAVLYGQDRSSIMSPIANPKATLDGAYIPAVPTTELLHLRPLAGPEDAEWCARVMSASEPWLTLRRGYEASLRIVSDPSREVHVAWGGTERLGFAILNMKGAFVGYPICVVREARGRGVGSWLMAFVEERVFRESPNFFLCVSSFNPDARRLYERLGFEVVGALRDYIVRGHDEILMRKTRGSLDDFHRGG